MSQSLEELTDLSTRFGLPKYRAEQVFTWLHKKNAKSFYDMTNLPGNVQSLLDENCVIHKQECIKKFVSKSDGTIKHLHMLQDGALVESVAMEYRFGKSICISTQAGCKMGCVFCASGETGLERDLTAGEMLAQVYSTSSVKRIVLMGCGEPLDNFDNVVKFIRLVTHEKGLNMGARHITLSTCGLVPKIYELAKMGLQINLAVSLHAPTDALRIKLMPIAKTYGIGELMKACKHYASTTKRQVTYEYSLIRDINDDEGCAAKLAKLIVGSQSHVNLIPVNPSSSTHMPSSKKKAAEFAQILQNHGISTTIRRSTGGDINAACGQLRGGF